MAKYSQQRSSKESKEIDSVTVFFAHQLLYTHLRVSNGGDLGAVFMALHVRHTMI